jgi:hypothetical protein
MPQYKKESQLSKDVKDAVKACGGRPIKYHGSCYSEAGVPDLIVCYKGEFVWMETKREGETSTPVQLAVQKELDEAGAIGCEIFSVPEALALLEIADKRLDIIQRPLCDTTVLAAVSKRIFLRRKANRLTPV